MIKAIFIQVFKISRLTPYQKESRFARFFETALCADWINSNSSGAKDPAKSFSSLIGTCLWGCTRAGRHSGLVSYTFFYGHQRNVTLQNGDKLALTSTPVVASGKTCFSEATWVAKTATHSYPVPLAAPFARYAPVPRGIAKLVIFVFGFVYHNCHIVHISITAGLLTYGAQ